jgi:hypothetical protein
LIYNKILINSFSQNWKKLTSVFGHKANGIADPNTLIHVLVFDLKYCNAKVRSRRMDFQKLYLGKPDPDHYPF